MPGPVRRPTCTCPWTTKTAVAPGLTSTAYKVPRTEAIACGVLIWKGREVSKSIRTAFVSRRTAWGGPSDAGARICSLAAASASMSKPPGQRIMVRGGSRKITDVQVPSCCATAAPQVMIRRAATAKRVRNVETCIRRLPRALPSFPKISSRSPFPASAHFRFTSRRKRRFSPDRAFAQEAWRQQCCHGTSSHRSVLLAAGR